MRRERDAHRTVRLAAVGDIYFHRTHSERPYNDLGALLRPVESYHHGVIFYGISHFIFDLPAIISGFGFDRETVVVSLDFDRDVVQQALLTPVMMEEETGPRWPHPDEAERIHALLRDLSAPLGTRLTWDATTNAAVVT